MNPEKYLNNFDVNSIYRKILEKHDISSMEDHYSRHLFELKKKIPIINSHINEKIILR